MVWFHKRFLDILRYSLLVVILALSPQFSYGEVVTLPPSRHHQFQSLALINDEGVYLIARDGDRTLCALGTSAAFLEFSLGEARAQIVGIAGVRTAIRLTAFKTETLDADLGAALEVRQSPNFRWALRVVHTSGHAVDGVELPSLLGPNLGIESATLRAIYDIGQRVRLGASLRFNFNPDPASIKPFWGQQFVDYFPFGDEANPRAGRWFVSLGLEEQGASQWNLGLTAQTGFNFGSVFGDEHVTQARVALGLYTGPDPRMKYYVFLNRTVTFPFLGLFFRV